MHVSGHFQSAIASGSPFESLNEQQEEGYARKRRSCTSVLNHSTTVMQMFHFMHGLLPGSRGTCEGKMS